MMLRVVAILLLFGATTAWAADDAAAVRSLISTTFDKPGLPVVSDPVVVEQNYAVADWVQGLKGGRALLRRNDDQWMIVLCAGDGIRQAADMIEAGVPQPVARQLANKLADAESHLTPEQLELFSRFITEEAAASHP